MAMSFTTTRHPATSGEQRYDAVQASPGSPSNGLNKQELPLSPSAPVRTRRLFTLGRAAGVAAAAAALTVAVTAVTQDRDASRAFQPDTAAAEVPSNQGHYGSADTAERWLTATSPQQSTTHYGSADTAERWLTATSPQQSTTHYGSADTAERWLTKAARPG
jgi:hypothetical protein